MARRKPIQDAGRFEDNFLEMLAAERGAAENTLDSYRRDLTRFAGFLRKDPADASAEDIRKYLKSLAGLGMAPSTSARHLSTLRQFYRFLFAEGFRAEYAWGRMEPEEGRFKYDIVKRLFHKAELSG